MKKHMSLVLALMLLLSLMACTSDGPASPAPDETTATETSVENAYTPGVYKGVGKGHAGEMTVEVEFSENKIESIVVGEHKETKGIYEPAVERIPSTIMEEQTLNVDVVTGATNTSKGILEAVADAVKQAGGDVEALRSKARVETEKSAEEISADVVVVGGGASGSAAALAAAEKGAHVILLEKAAGVSGAGSMAGALFADRSSLQIAAGKEVDAQWIYDQYIKDSNYHANAGLVSAIIHKSASTVDWLVENGVNLVVLDAGHGAQYNHVGMPATAHGYVDGGVMALQTIHEKVESYGGQVMYETPGESLIMDANGKIAGVIARKVDGTELRITAKSVVIATGGFGGNAEMMAERFGTKSGTGLVRTATGDGVKMAWSAGAAEAGIDVAQWFGMTYDADKSKNMTNPRELTELVRNPLMFVNKEGKRFGSEEEAYESAALGNMMYNQPNAEMFIILDTGIIERVAEEGLAKVFVDRWGHMYGQGIKFMEAGREQNIDALTEAWRMPRDYTAVMEEAVEAGLAIKADTIEELARLLDAPYLVEEVAYYNTMAANGKDTQFYKDASFMNPVAQAPYYAVVTKLRCLGTLGGVAINEEIQAVDEAGQTIENLWVAGADAGGMYGNSYVMFEGATLGFAYNSGRIAGENAAENAGK
ncbi:FAD-dependent oxidoreductase [Anoxynatronum sibiricum]|uniref:Urocanate reductase n=1 Tax=Anoxynatronum sibiricum TaxID=210623 RepID=A0ABU9VY99_9CLOT